MSLVGDGGRCGVGRVVQDGERLAFLCLDEGPPELDLETGFVLNPDGRSVTPFDGYAVGFFEVPRDSDEASTREAMPEMVPRTRKTAAAISHPMQRRFTTSHPSRVDQRSSLTSE